MVRGTNGSLYYLASNGSFSSVWTVIGIGGASGLGRPAIAFDGGWLNVFVRGVEAQLWDVVCSNVNCETPAAWSSYALGGVLASDPAASSPRDIIRVDIVAASFDGAAFPVPSPAKGLWQKTNPWE